MSTGKTSVTESSEPALDDERVREYLEEHSEFFERNPDLLDQLQISHSSGSAVSLVERQISVLRERNMDMRKRLTALTGNARDNDRLNELTDKLVLALLEAKTLEALTTTFTRSMTEDFGVEYSTIILFGDPAQSSSDCRVDSRDSARSEIGPLIRGRRPVCGPLRDTELSYLFPKAGEIGSAAVIPLCNESDLGVIAVGSSDAHHFQRDMGTLFLNHVADVLLRLLPPLAPDGSAEEP